MVAVAAKRWFGGVGIALNMLVVAVFIGAYAYRRETISGFVGRYAAGGYKWARRVSRIIDKLHPHEPNHCQVTFYCEHSARQAAWFGCSSR